MKMKKYILVALAVLSMVSCGEKKFHVEGTITNAQDSVLYFENIGISEITVVDSVKLNSEGHFSFSGQPVDAPEFYRLRISDQIINVSVDSTETITIRAQYPQMASQYEVEGSDNCLKIKELSLLQQNLLQRAIRVSEIEGLTVRETNDSLRAMIDQYKENIKLKYIFAAPDKPYAYFALFQTLGNMLLFNPRTSKDDIKAYAAVATSWDTYYPGSERGANLHNIAIEGMNTLRIQAAAQAKATIPADKIQTTGLIDIQLFDNHGRQRSLTDLQGKVVLLDFHLFAADDSPARILMLRGLYNKFHAQGLEIYQVSIDPDEHFWKQQTAALPWISVRDPQGPQSVTFAIYNVQAIPEFFLIDRDNNIIGRSETIGDLEQAIRKLL
ncbi:MAG: AhpC/TSA family protein [Prevotella sp.]|nr:AhpC/TSA family protein [Prevotella sp.]